MGRTARRTQTDEAAVTAAAQAALAAEHAAVYGYGVVGGRLGDERSREVEEAYAAHRSRRNALERLLRDRGDSPVAAAAAYDLPFAVADQRDAVRLAAELESRVAGAYADLVQAAEGETRRTAAEALRDAAVRAARWSGEVVAFPGLGERDAAVMAPGSEGR
ncbi:ferritin-like domain-containing protein [Streptomyces sp. 7-21]|uniref:ferritin-like domain-containing protein n=1 Tax=Streptomyces sp. 7-21 TaxID=2802283 RepID=UPI00191CCF2A|nr:ferritin-like domain-containing protein [Streptomyces sp. 7-21]MBL1068321.1 ferritin-like domain-containing protein [Streptomyces sp. 7-21]